MGVTRFKSHIIAMGGITGAGAGSFAGIFGTVFYVDGTNGSDTYDGKSPIRAFKTIQAAVDATTDGAGDLIIIGPGLYYENVLIKDKNDLTLMGVSSGCDERVTVRPGGASSGSGGDFVLVHAEAPTVYPFNTPGGLAVAGSAITIVSRHVEICGLTFDASGFKPEDGAEYSLYNGIYIGDGGRINPDYAEDADGSYIHDCIFKRGCWGLMMDGCSEDHRIENNLFYRQEGGVTKGGIQICPGANKDSERIYVLNNIFNAIESLAYGIYMYDSDDTINCVFKGNLFKDRKGESMTDAICLQGAGNHTISGNYFACTNAYAASGTDLCCGNYKGVAGSTEDFVTTSA